MYSCDCFALTALGAPWLGMQASGIDLLRQKLAPVEIAAVRAACPQSSPGIPEMPVPSHSLLLEVVGGGILVSLPVMSVSLTDWKLQTNFYGLIAISLSVNPWKNSILTVLHCVFMVSWHRDVALRHRCRCFLAQALHSMQAEHKNAEEAFETHVNLEQLTPYGIARRKHYGSLRWLKDLIVRCKKF